ncbi:MAG TPA: hypothetical protein VFQ61_17080, partial [Polyangiaceae bacterium]|nr:hypothetical protein [Polyangiaceae bacterium]
IFADDQRIEFHEDVSAVPTADIVFMSGVLQYIEDYPGVLRDLTERFHPRLFVLTLLPTGSFPTFASAQVNLEGSTMPAWFFNEAALLDQFGALGYELVLRGAATLEFDMSDFDPAHRLDGMSNWILRAKSARK